MAATINGALFKEIIAEMRENTLKRLTSPTAVAESEEENHLGDYVPSQRLHEDYSRLRSLPSPVSNDDELDDAVQQIKTTGNSGATKTANNSQSGITGALNRYRSDRDAAEFDGKMRATLDSALSDVTDAVNATFDKARQVGENLSSTQQNAILSLVHTLQVDFREIWNRISNFIDDAVGNIVSFSEDGTSKTSEFFAGISSYIKDNF